MPEKGETKAQGCERVVPLQLDVTNSSQIRQAADEIENLDVLINNAGIAIYDDLSDIDVIEKHLAVNSLGPLRMTQAFLSVLKRSKGAVINNLSMVGLATNKVSESFNGFAAYPSRNRFLDQVQNGTLQPLPGSVCPDVDLKDGWKAVQYRTVPHDLCSCMPFGQFRQPPRIGKLFKT